MMSRATKLRRYIFLKALGIFVCAVVLLFPEPGQAASATLGIIPSSATYTRGQIFSVSVVVNTDTAINAAEATVRFPASLLEVQSISKSGSKFTLWSSEPSYSNGSGTVTFSGGLPSPGFTGNGGKILTLTFKAKATGTANLTFSGAQVLANDGNGTNILTQTGSASYTIKEPVAAPPPEPTRPAPTIQSSTHPDQNVWYTTREITASWSAGSDARGFSTVYDTIENTVPSEIDQGRSGGASYTVAEDGMRYLHVRARYDSGWSGTTHYTFHIDGTAPEPFELQIVRENANSRTALIFFGTTDATSGIARYEVKIDDGTFAEQTSPMTLGDLSVSGHTVTVRAVDKAGNTQEGSATFMVSANPAPSVFLDVSKKNLLWSSGDIPVILIGESFVLRGYAPLDSTLRIVVRSHESVFEFPVEDSIDPSPIEPAPEGLTAWKVEIPGDWSPGDHTITITTIDSGGNESLPAPVLKFHVATDTVRIGSIFIPSSFLVIGLGVLVGVLGLLVALLLVFLFRVRWKLRAHGEKTKNSHSNSVRPHL